MTLTRMIYVSCASQQTVDRLFNALEGRMTPVDQASVRRPPLWRRWWYRCQQYLGLSPRSSQGDPRPGAPGRGA